MVSGSRGAGQKTRRLGGRPGLLRSTDEQPPLLQQFFAQNRSSLLPTNGLRRGYPAVFFLGKPIATAELVIVLSNLPNTDSTPRPCAALRGRNFSSNCARRRGRRWSAIRLLSSFRQKAGRSQLSRWQQCGKTPWYLLERLARPALGGRVRTRSGQLLSRDHNPKFHQGRQIRLTGGCTFENDLCDGCSIRRSLHLWRQGSY